MTMRFFFNKKAGVMLTFLFGEKTLTKIFLFIKRGLCFYKEKKCKQEKPYVTMSHKRNSLK